MSFGGAGRRQRGAVENLADVVVGKTWGPSFLVQSHAILAAVVRIKRSADTRGAGEKATASQGVVRCSDAVVQPPGNEELFATELNAWVGVRLELQWFWLRGLLHSLCRLRLVPLRWMRKEGTRDFKLVRSQVVVLNLRFNGVDINRCKQSRV
jgi:hypothetical protein